MVCFTDLPNGIVGKHWRRYGKYAIVLYKEWCNKHKISPILYLRKQGRMTDFVRHIYDADSITINKTNLLAFCKPYCAKYRDKDGKISKENRRFYDEREWRYVPYNFSEYVGKQQYDAVLPFDIKDIAQIYVTDENEKFILCDKYPDLKRIIKVVQ